MIFVLFSSIISIKSPTRLLVPQELRVRFTPFLPICYNPQMIYLLSPSIFLLKRHKLQFLLRQKKKKFSTNTFVFKLVSLTQDHQLSSPRSRICFCRFSPPFADRFFLFSFFFFYFPIL